MDCFCLSTLVQPSLLIAGWTIPDSKYKSSTLLGFRTYRYGHNTETALLPVYNDIVTMAGKGNGSYLVLLDLSAAFDTIDHDTLLLYWGNML